MKFSKKMWVTLAIVVAALIAWNYVPRHSVASAVESSSIKKVANEQELQTIINEAGSKLVVFDLYADWCGPCRMLHPTLAALADTFAGKALFYQINVDENPGIATAFQTGGIPYVVFVKDKQVVQSLVGLHPASSYKEIIAGFNSDK